MTWRRWPNCRRAWRRRGQRDSPVARVSYDGRMVEYRGTAEINSAIAELERELQALQGKAPVRQIRIYTSKGL
jgi:hypothetical protein